MARNLMWFMLPQSLNALISTTGEDRDHLPFYINPQTVDIKEAKLVNHTLAKGGYIVQYWGEELPVMSVNGTTGSGGIEAIEILRDVYRHEQLIMRRILLERAQNFAAFANETLEDSSSATGTAGLLSAVDSLLDGGATSIIEGTRSVIEAVSDALLGEEDEPGKVGLVPSTGAFAVSIDIFFQGVKYRGFFKDFSFNESAERPGLFDYSFTFMVTRRTGRRRNFMPWHRNPAYPNGRPRPASIPLMGAMTNELSFPTDADYGNTQESIISSRGRSEFNQTQEGEAETNQVPVRRRSVF
nr:hypothetical protein 99 [bacterium]